MPRKKKYEDRNCVICDEEFITEVSNKKGASKRTCGKRKCQDILRLKTTYDKTCVICEKEYESVRVNSKYCSDECRSKRYEITCINCNNKKRVDRPEIKLCSRECENNYKKSLIGIVKCDYCDSEIKRTKNHIFSTKNNFCDSKCSNNYWGYMLFSGKSKYGGGWGTIRKNTLKYYNKRCQCCNAKVTLKSCNIHHIIPIQYFTEEQIHIANSIENLLPLCIECHKEVHRNNNKWYEENFKSGEFLKI